MNRHMECLAEYLIVDNGVGASCPSATSYAATHWQKPRYS